MYLGERWLQREKPWWSVCLTFPDRLTPRFWIHYPIENQRNCVAYKLSKLPKNSKRTFIHPTSYSSNAPLTNSPHISFWLFLSHPVTHKYCVHRRCTRETASAEVVSTEMNEWMKSRNEWMAHPSQTRIFWEGWWSILVRSLLARDWFVMRTPYCTLDRRRFELRMIRMLLALSASCVFSSIDLYL